MTSRQHDRGAGVRLIVALLVCGMSGCATGGYYRLPASPTADGSMSNEVVYAYFALSKPAFGLAPSYSEFDPETDGSVTFILHVDKTRRDMFRDQRGFEIRGILHRPDGSIHSEFSRDVSDFVPGTQVAYTTHHDFQMETLRPWPGWWTLDVLKEGALVGRYRFLLADASSVARLRGPGR